MAKKPLDQAVLERLQECESGLPMFSPAALEALRLSDIFSSVTAPEYVLPLDAMAGFPRQTNTEKQD